MKTFNCLRKISFLGTLLGLLMMAGCDQNDEESEKAQLDHFSAVKVEHDPVPLGQLPEKRADNFSPVPEDTPFFYKPELKQAQCFAAVNTFVRGRKGNNCIIGNPNQAMAEIAGSSERCVANCDTPARLQEANLSAAGTCNAFCAQFQCGAQYAPRRQCGASNCYAGDPACNAQWPKMDYCMLLQGARVWNCECLPRVIP